MSRPSRELGAAKATVIVVAAAVTVLGGIAYMLNGNVPFATAKNPLPSAKVEFVQPTAPVVAEPVKANSEDEELKRLKKGQLVQYRDKSGNMLLRSNTPVMGKTGDGRDIQFNVSARASLVPMGKAKGAGSKDEKAKHKKGAGKAPLKFANSNGRLTPMGAASGGDKPAEGGK